MLVAHLGEMPTKKQQKILKVPWNEVNWTTVSTPTHKRKKYATLRAIATKTVIQAKKPKVTANIAVASGSMLKKNIFVFVTYGRSYLN